MYFKIGNLDGRHASSYEYSCPLQSFVKDSVITSIFLKKASQ